MASEVVTNAEKANSMMPSDEIRYNERKAFLLRARAALVALDLHLARVYEVLLLNGIMKSDKQYLAKKLKEK